MARNINKPFNHGLDTKSKEYRRICSLCYRKNISIEEYFSDPEEYKAKPNGGSLRRKHLEYERGSKEYKKTLALHREYGIYLSDYNKMFEDQKGCCAICGTHQLGLKESLFVDHNHTTGEVRSLLCKKCNSAIGLLQDSSELVFKAALYLEKFNNLTI